jgi:prevent-host-death family protein
MVICMVMRIPRGKANPPATMSAAEFKATCLELMDAVERTGRSVVVTKRGHPVAVLSPVRATRRSAFGYMKGRIKILGDIVAPIEVDWDADR